MLVKPKLTQASALDNETNSTHALNRIHFPLNADGTLDYGVDEITLRYGEGAVLIKPDLFISNISFSPPEPIEGENVGITAIVKSDIDVANVNVQFFLGNPYANGTLIGNASVNIVNGTGITQTFWNCSMHAGQYEIYVIIDSDEIYADSNRSNNLAFKVINILYQIALREN